MANCKLVVAVIQEYPNDTLNDNIIIGKLVSVILHGGNGVELPQIPLLLFPPSCPSPSPCVIITVPSSSTPSHFVHSHSLRALPPHPNHAPPTPRRPHRMHNFWSNYDRNLYTCMYTHIIHCHVSIRGY